MLNNKNKLLILGNGFDLNFNLKTSYSDFYNRTKKYDKEKEEVILEFFKFYIKEKMNIEEEKYEELIELYGIEFKEIIKSEMKKLFDENSQKYLWSNYKDIIEKYIEDLTKRITENENMNTGLRSIIREYNFKSEKIYTSYLNLVFWLKNHNSWFQLEELIKYILYQFMNYIKCEKNKKRHVIKDYSSIQNREDEIEVLIIEFLIRNIPRDSGVASEIYKSLSEIEIEFGKYLEENIKVSNEELENMKKYIYRIMLELEELNNIEVLSFNYTIFADEIFMYKVRHIHGTMKNPIFGIDILDTIGKDVDDEDRKYLVKFTKTYRVLQQQESNNLFILNKNVNEIIFFGHSLGEMDYSYFNSIFDFYDIYSSNIKLKFLYTKYNENAFSIMLDSVANLIERYGKTLDNKDKGANLLHKLMLEGRLIIKEIQTYNDFIKENN